METAKFYITAGHAAFAVIGIDQILRLALKNSAETMANAQGNQRVPAGK